jgi:iron complex transport system permease protein
MSVVALTPARFALTWAGCLAAWAVVAAACLFVGSAGAVGWPDSEFTFTYRRDVVLVASLVGAALAASGVAYQAVLRNPLADPYLLGASTGAALASYLWRLPAFAGAAAYVGLSAAAVSQQAMAFAGAVLAVGAVFALAGRRGRLEPVTAILTGVIVNAVLASVYLLINALVQDLPGTGGAVGLIVGTLQTSLTAEQKIAAAALVGVGVIGLALVGASLNAATLSDDEATSLGVRIQRLRWIALGLGSLAVAAGVAISGPIGFVGLIAPHVARLLVGQDVRRVLPASLACGAGLLTVADALSRWLAHADRLGTQLPVGVLMSLLGGPVFLAMLSRRVRQD